MYLNKNFTFKIYFIASYLKKYIITLYVETCICVVYIQCLQIMKFINFLNCNTHLILINKRHVNSKRSQLWGDFFSYVRYKVPTIYDPPKAMSSPLNTMSLH